MKMIIAAFCDRAAAEQAASYLRTKQPDGQVQLLNYQDGVLDTLRSHDIPHERVDLYAEALRRGAVLLVARVDDDDAQEIAAELDRLGSLDLDAAGQRWRESGWTGFDATSQPYDEAALTAERADLERESIPIVEEQVAIGKRQVQRGGIRVRTFITEQPVHETVQLREEHIDVHREQVNEPISPAAADSTFREDEYVVTATGEEAVVGKEARVVERVHVGKTAETREETIEETERRTDVEVEQLEEPLRPNR